MFEYGFGNSVCESTVFSSSLLRFFFFDYAIDTAFLKSRLETAIAGDTACRREVTFFPAIDKPRLPDEWARHGNVIDATIDNCLINNCKGSEPSYCHNGASDRFFDLQGKC